MRDPTGIATNSVGEMIVTQWEGDIIKINNEGMKPVLVKHSQTKLRVAQLRSIAEMMRTVKGPRHWGMMVVGDEVMLCEHNNIGTMVYDRECNKYGGNIQVYKVKQVKGSGHWGMTVQLLEMNDSSCVTIITRALLVYNREIFCHIH